MTLKEYLQTKQLLMDGAMGTYYARLTGNDQEMPEVASLKNPDLIKDIHLEYIDAGARLIRTNTFATNTAMITMDEIKQKEMITKSCEIAKTAVTIAKKNGLKEKVWVGGSIGPIVMPGIEEEEQVIAEYKRICNVMLSCNIDAIIFETFDDIRMLVPVIEYVRSKSDIFIMTNFAVNKNGYTQSGISAQRILKLTEQVEGIDACGFNCGIGSGHMLKLVKGLQLPVNKYFAVLPNASYPEQVQNRLVFLENAKYFRENMKQIRKMGVHLVGGCCGTTPSYINALQMDEENYTVGDISKVTVKEEALKQSNKKMNPLLKKLNEGKKVVAVELDPPYDADCSKVIECAKKLGMADVITMADSPMGRSRVDSVLMSIKLSLETNRQVMPHISCRDRNMISMRSTLLGAYIHGIRNCLLVTGDPVPSVSRLNTTGVFDCNSVKLMHFVKEMNEEHFSEDPIIYGGALNHGRGILEKVAERMQKKVDAGCSYFLTQPIYCKEDMERIARLKEMVDTKIICGIMPLVSYRNANFIKNEMTGIHVPDEIVNRYTLEMTKEEAEWVGAEISNEIIDQLKDIADGYYFMLPFNRVSLMDKIMIK